MKSLKKYKVDSKFAKVTVKTKVAQFFFDSQCIYFFENFKTKVFNARVYARAVLGVVILSVRPSVCLSVCLSHACIVTKLNDALQIF